MRMPGFTAEAALGHANHSYRNQSPATTRAEGELYPALVAPTVCTTSRCLTIGNCRTKVRCCRNFTGSCTCSATPCYYV
jgi:hypothetical protein